MPRSRRASHVILTLLFVWSVAVWSVAPARAYAAAAPPAVSLRVVDENGIAVADAQVTLTQPGRPPLPLQTDYAGRVGYSLARGSAPYQLRVDKPGFYQTVAGDIDPQVAGVRLVLTHQQIIREQVSVTASAPGIDRRQTSGMIAMNTPEIVNIPYPTSRDIRNLLPFIPGVVQDESGQVHVAGSETYATLDLLDGFDMRSPVSGELAMRVSADAVRSIEVENTRYPVEFGRATGGVIAYFTGMGDNRFRFNATNFVPSWREKNGLHFDKFVPRVTFSGPLARNRAWFFDGAELEYDNIYIPELPSGANTNELWREGNLIKAQVNLAQRDILIGGLLFNNYHSPYDGLSSLTPQESTTKRTTIAWLPYLREQHSFAGGALLEAGVAVQKIRDGYVPRGDAPFEITPERSQGSYFENLTGHSRRAEETAALYLPPRRWLGVHDFKAGLDLDQIGFDEQWSRSPVHYLREDKTLLRLSTFPAQPAFTRSNLEVGAYFQDRWSPSKQLLLEPGLRFDWDEILRRPVYSPRLAMTYVPRSGTRTKLSAGIGLYYEHTQLEYLEEALAGLREDTNYAADGVTPLGPPQGTSFVAQAAALHQPHVLNWSAGIEHKFPGSIYATMNWLDKRGSNGFVYANENSPALSGTYLLTNGRTFTYHSIDLSLRHSFSNGYVLFGSYTRSSAHTNAALDYSPTLSILGPQQGGPLAWDVPNRLLSWGWLPLPKIRNWDRGWDFVYTVDWRTGVPFTSVDANQQMVGAPGSNRFPNYISFDPGLEWKFHFHGSYFGLRGVLENATGSQDPVVVNNVVDSPEYGLFTEPQGRAFTARLRLIGSK